MSLVYVLNKDGLPLMPTHKLGKVRHLLKEGRAKIVKRNPFTIKLNYDIERHFIHTCISQINHII